MSHTLYATFAKPEDAERAAGALLDSGVRPEDLSVVRQPQDGFTSATEPRVTASNVADVPVGTAPDVVYEEDEAEHDARVAHEAKEKAKIGAGIGAGVGTLAAIAAIMVPGVGLVLGVGALAAALGGIASVAGVGAATGAIVAYMKDAGVDETTAGEYGRTVAGGGAILAVTVPSDTVDEEAANAILSRHGATNVNRYAARGYVA